MENSFDKDALDGVLESFAPVRPDWDFEPPARTKRRGLPAELAVMSLIGLLGLGVLELVSRRRGRLGRESGSERLGLE